MLTCANYHLTQSTDEYDKNIISDAGILSQTKAMDKLKFNIFTIRPEGNMIVCSKRHSNPSNSSKDISLKTKNVWTKVVDQLADQHFNPCNPNPSNILYVIYVMVLFMYGH